MASDLAASHLDMHLPAGWACHELGDLVDQDRGISYGIVQPGKNDISGVPIVRVNNIRAGRIETSDVLRVAPTTEQKYQRTRLRGGEVLLSLVGTLGECAVVPQELAGWNVARAVAVIPLKDGINSRWVVTCLRSRQLQHLIRTWATTTVQATLNLRDVRRLPVLMPPDGEVEGLMNLVNPFDDKIELNRQMNRTLEAMARAIFKAWFVDFEPVKAKAAGATSFRGMPQDVFDQLPARLTESELGPVPEGWEVGTLDDLVKERRSRVTPSNETYSMPYVPIDCITSKSISLEQSKSGGEARSSLIRFDEDDILFGAMRPYFHKVCLAPFSGTTRTTAFVLRPKQNNDLSFALLLLSEASTIDFATQHSVGSTIPYAKWENSLASMPIVYPDKSVRSAFHSIVGPFLDLTKGRYFENRTLSELRDTLLPKLISGEIRGPEVLGGADAG